MTPGQVLYGTIPHHSAPLSSTMVLLRRPPLGHVSALRSSPFLTTAARAGADLGKTARKAASARRDRVLPQAGNIPGGGVKGAAHAQAERRGHVRVPARAHDLQRVRGT